MNRGTRRGTNLRAGALVLALVVAGCAHYGAVSPGERLSIDGAFDIDPQRMWSRLGEGRVEMWTVDGPLLESVVLYKGIGDGDALRKPPPGLREKDLPKFRKDMTALEVRELWEATATRVSNLTVRMLEMQPWSFGGTDGFRFDYRYRTSEGLDTRGFAVGTIYRDKLYLIAFTAAELHYYDAYAKDVEKIIASITKT